MRLSDCLKLHAKVICEVKYKKPEPMWFGRLPCLEYLSSLSARSSEPKHKLNHLGDDGGGRNSTTVQPGRAHSAMLLTET